MIFACKKIAGEFLTFDLQLFYFFYNISVVVSIYFFLIKIFLTFIPLRKFRKSLRNIDLFQYFVDHILHIDAFCFCFIGQTNAMTNTSLQMLRTSSGMTNPRLFKNACDFAAMPN